MYTRIIKIREIPDLSQSLKWRFTKMEPIMLLSLLVVLWLFLPEIIQLNDATIPLINPNILLLIVLSLISFMIVSTLCWWLLQRFWMAIGLPDFKLMVSHFKNLTAWQQLSFYWLSFALLLYAALGCLSSIC